MKTRLMRRKCRLPLASRLQIEWLEQREMLAADISISEFLASNNGGLRDASGSSPDWIEVFNGGDEPVDLAGYGLTDTPEDADAWIFPHRVVNPGEHLVVFASGNSGDSSVDALGNLHADFMLDRQGEYLALQSPDGQVLSEFGSADKNYPDQLSNVSFGIAQELTLIDASTDAWYTIPTDDDLGWTMAGFDAQANGYVAGKASLGFETRPTNRVNFSGAFETELPPSAFAAYVRMEFALNDASAISNLTLSIKRDNGFVAYLNGQKILEDNVPTLLGWFATAPNNSPRDSEALTGEHFDLTNHTDKLVDGTNVLGFHLLNNSRDSSDMLLVPTLKAGASDFAAATGNPAKVGYMATPTPGSPNVSNTEVFPNFVKDTKFSTNRGFYDEPFQVEISTATEGALIRYTRDGSEPTLNVGQDYSGPITVSTTTNLRAAAFKKNHLPTNVDTHSYVFLSDVIQQPAEIPGFPFGGRVWAGSNTYVPQDTEMDPEIVNDPAYKDVMRASLQSVPTISVTSDISDVFGDSGWYDGEDIEVPVSVEVMYPADPSRNHQAEAGIESHSHDRLKRSLRLNFRGEYGDPSLTTDLFQTAPLNGDTATDKVDRIVLRGGNNRSWARIWNPDKTAYTTDEFYRANQLAMSGYGMRSNFAHLYINGVYWGLYNPVERADSFFTSEYFGGFEDHWFAVNHGGDLSGDDDRFDFIRTELAGRDADVTSAEKYEEFKQYVDVESFADYLINSWWMAVSDWPQNNWYAGLRNEISELGPTLLRFFAWDGEWSWGQGGQSSSTGRAHVHSDFRSRSNNRGSIITQIWHVARQNDDFMMMFADRVYKHLFNDGAMTEQNATRRWLTLTDYVKDAVVAESARWGDALEAARQPTRTRDVDWLNEVNRVLGLMDGNNDVFIRALRSEGYYPSIDPPTLNQHGGFVDAGFPLRLVNPNANGVVYFTTDGSDPRASGGAVSATAANYSGPLTLSGGSVITARVLAGGQWSALTSAKFEINSGFPLRVTELNYNPHDANVVQSLDELDVGNDQFEFIEFVNTSDRMIDLAGVQLVETDVDGDEQGVRFAFAPRTLAPGERIVTVRNLDAFQSRYGGAVPIATGISDDGEPIKEYAGRLSNNGERITLLDPTGAVIQRFTYQTTDAWPWRANGLGSSLEVIDWNSNFEDPSNWQPSSQFGGSPGTAGQFESTSYVNEILARSSEPDGDRIELMNPTGETVDFSGWYISNTTTDVLKTTIAAPAVAKPSGYVVLSEAQLGFSLDDGGGEITLVETDNAGRPVRFADHAVYGASLPDISLGLIAERGDEWQLLAEPTFGRVNSGPRTGDVVITEVYFAPIDPDGQGTIHADDMEFVEIHNHGQHDVSLRDWRMEGAAEYDFEDDAVIHAGETQIIVGFRPTDALKLASIQFLLGVDATTTVHGPYSSPLSDESGALRLMRPTVVFDSPSSNSRITEDGINFGSGAPWPSGLAGEGNSLTRTRAVDDGRSSTSWLSRAPTPGSVAFFERLAGDANDDGIFNQLDIIQVLQAAKYLTGQAASWAEGDWNGDGLFDQADIVAALRSLEPGVRV